MKFKVGDIVRGVSNSPYAITDENMTKGEVVSVRRFSCGDDIQVKVLEHKTKPEAIGRQIFTKSKYFEPVCEHKLVVTEEGNKTLAWLCENDKIIHTAKIECSPKEAFERLMEKQNNLVSYLKDVIVGDFCGRIGTPTKMKDMAGKPLFVGDVVEVTAKGIETCGNAYVVECNDKCFVWGIKPGCSADGAIADDWVVIKRKSYKELENGEVHHYVKAILEESKNIKINSLPKKIW